MSKGKKQYIKSLACLIGIGLCIAGWFAFILAGQFIWVFMPLSLSICGYGVLAYTLAYMDLLERCKE